MRALLLIGLLFCYFTDLSGRQIEVKGDILIEEIKPGEF